MIVRIEDLKESCSKILNAVDSDASPITETLELIVKDKFLYMSLTNREYFVTVRFDIGDDIEFHATVNANLFLKLVSQITTDTVEFIIDKHILVIKGNGTYKLPMIYDDSELLELPKIVINNPTVSFDIDYDILNSISFYNSREIAKGIFSKPVQKYYYIDENGCITFTTGACVNNFSLDKPVKILLNDKTIKLFKLFKNGLVHFTLGYDAISEDIVQTKVKFETDNAILTVILSCDESMINSVPASVIRERANKIYKYMTIFNKDELMQAINRLMLFTASNSVFSPYCNLEFDSKSLTLLDRHKDNKETIFYINENSGIGDDTYSAMLDLKDLKLTLESCKDEFITMAFGDNSAFVIKRNTVSNVIPEVRIN